MVLKPRRLSFSYIEYGQEYSYELVGAATGYGLKSRYSIPVKGKLLFSIKTYGPHLVPTEPLCNAYRTFFP
jgi:hypothetical protein